MLICKQSSETSIWGVWKVEETLETLLGDLQNTDFAEHVSSSKRLFEQASVRVLLKSLLDEEKAIEYLPSGKPYLKDSLYHISISHTKGYSAVLLSKQVTVGIDIECISDKVKQVRSRFVSKCEHIDAEHELIHLLLHWSAKETLYKAMDCVGVDLKQHLLIDPFTPSQSGCFKAKEKYTKHENSFDIRYFVQTDYVLTMTC
ncbi:MAG: hypothetical protein RL662_389 [Bacteroidota bacterium]|jgi:phosphopantetheinyl transferase